MYVIRMIFKKTLLAPFLYTSELLCVLGETGCSLGVCIPLVLGSSSQVLLSSVFKSSVLIVKLEKLQKNIKSLAVQRRLSLVGR